MGMGKVRDTVDRSSQPARGRHQLQPRPLARLDALLIASVCAVSLSAPVCLSMSTHLQEATHLVAVSLVDLMLRQQRWLLRR